MLISMLKATCDAFGRNKTDAKWQNVKKKTIQKTKNKERKN